MILSSLLLNSCEVIAGTSQGQHRALDLHVAAVAKQALPHRTRLYVFIFFLPFPRLICP